MHTCHTTGVYCMIDERRGSLHQVHICVRRSRDLFRDLQSCPSTTLQPLSPLHHLYTITYTMAPSTAETSKPKQRSDLLRFSTHRHLRQRILLSVLSGKSLRIDNIRSDDVHVGLRDYEVNLLRLVEKVTNGSTIEISVTGMSPCQ